MNTESVKPKTDSAESLSTAGLGLVERLDLMAGDMAENREPTPMNWREVVLEAAREMRRLRDSPRAVSPEEAYDHICGIAMEHALILNAGGGVVTIVHPDTQRAESLYDHIQYVHGLGAHPDTLERERAEVSNV